jgi:poly(A) polymerase
VPILTFDWEEDNIDLLVARLNSASVPKDFDINDDKVLDGVDSAPEKSLNGPRVTNLIAVLVSRKGCEMCSELGKGARIVF